jgi:hypothetical protein
MRMARERRPRSLPSCVPSAIPSTSLLFLGENRFHCTQDTSIGAGMLGVKSVRIGRPHDYAMHMHENPILSYTVPHYFVSRVVVCVVSKVVPASTHSDRSTPRYSSISPGLPLFRCLVACLARSLFSTRRAPRVDTSWLCPSHVANMQSPLDLVISNRSLVFVSCPEILFRATTAPVLESETVHYSLCKCQSAAWCASAVHQPSSHCTTRWL